MSLDSSRPKRAIAPPLRSICSSVTTHGPWDKNRPRFIDSPKLLSYMVRGAAPYPSRLRAGLLSYMVRSAAPYPSRLRAGLLSYMVRGAAPYQWHFAPLK